MRSSNCRNIRIEIEEAGSADYLGHDTVAHLSNCAECEALARQHGRLHSILSNLGTVAAPGDFDFKLKARLASDKNARASFSLLSFSFGSRGLAVAMLLLLIATAMVYVKVKSSSSNNSLATNKEQAVPVAVEPNSSQPTVAVTTEAAAPEKEVATPRATDERSYRQAKNELAAIRPSRTRSRDFASTAAPILTSDGRQAFAINASYQPLKVSVDDGRGASRTISLPSVSFGSESGLSQTASPLMASARGSW